MDCNHFNLIDRNFLVNLCIKTYVLRHLRSHLFTCSSATSSSESGPVLGIRKFSIFLTSPATESLLPQLFSFEFAYTCSCSKLATLIENYSMIEMKSTFGEPLTYPSITSKWSTYIPRKHPDKPTSMSPAQKNNSLSNLPWFEINLNIQQVCLYWKRKKERNEISWECSG